MFGPGGGSHTGIVIAYDAATITTIEGNTNVSGSAEGDGVYRKTRQRRDTYVHGYGYPDYPGGIRSADPNWKNPTPEEEDPMAGITKSDIYDAVWNTDSVPAPAAAPDIKTNPAWRAQVYLRSIYNQNQARQIAGLTAAVGKPAGLVGKGVDTAAVVAAVERAIEAAVIDVNINTTPEA